MTHDPQMVERCLPVMRGYGVMGEDVARTLVRRVLEASHHAELVAVAEQIVAASTLAQLDGPIAKAARAVLAKIGGAQ